MGAGFIRLLLINKIQSKKREQNGYIRQVLSFFKVFFTAFQGKEVSLQVL